MSQQPNLISRILVDTNDSGSSTTRRIMDDSNLNTADIQDPEQSPRRPFTLVLVSHSHAPPLHLEPQLKFDLRKTSNPPKHIRDAYDGRSKRLREHMLSSDEFCALLDTAQARIEEQMASITEHHREGPGKHIPAPRPRPQWFRSAHRG